MQRQIDKLEKDTYAARKAEGRPKHGWTSYTILGVGAVSWLMLAMAIAIPSWRTNWIGILGYPHTRSWGLFSVVGMQSKMHHEYMTDMCRYFSQLNVGGVCASPICLWYRLKCQTSMDMIFVNYGVAFGLMLCLIFHSLCLMWTSRMTPRFIKWAAIWWVAQVLVHVCLVVLYWMMTSETFSSLDSQSMYPEPDVGFCFYLECLVIMCLCTIATLGLTLMKMWPEESSSGSSDDDSDEESDEDGQQAGAPPMMAPPMAGPGMYGAPGVPQMGAAPGMMPPGAMGPGGMAPAY